MRDLRLRSALARVRSLLRYLTGRARADRGLADEIEFHLQARTEHWTERGLTPADAYRKARLEFGAVEQHKERWREARGLRLHDELCGDLTYAWRLLRGAPAFTVVSVAILAIGIGANMAVFRVLDAVMLRTLPVARPAALRELAWIENASSTWSMSYNGSMRPYDGGDRLATSFAYPAYAGVRDNARSIQDLILFTRYDLNVGSGGRERRLPALIVSGNFMTGLGAGLLVGRAIEPADDRAGAPPVAVLTHAAWERLFGGEPASALGQTITLNASPAVVVGITSPEFYGVEPGWPIDVLAPVSPMMPILEPARQPLTDVRYWGFQMLARVPPGVDDERVRGEVETLVRRAMPPEFSGERGELRRIVVRDASQGLDSLRRNYADQLYLLMAIMAAVLLIACANIAGLLAARAAARERELGLRVALGAGRGRLVRQVLTESALLTALGSAAGIALGWAASSRLMPLLNQENDPIVVPLGWTAWTTAFFIGLGLTVTLVCGMLPAVRAARAGLMPLLVRAMGGGRPGSTRLVAGKTLIVLQVTLSLVLLVGAALFSRTLVNLRSLPLGFRPDHLLLFDIDARSSGYQDTRLHDFYEQLLARVAAVPGLQSAAFSRYGLLAGGSTSDGVTVPGAPERGHIGVRIHHISPRYFETMGIPVLAGREFSGGDRDGSPRVMVINQALAERLPWGPRPVGRRLSYGDAEQEIVGLAGNAKFASIRDETEPTIYIPFRQHPQRGMTFAMRTAGPPGLLANAIRETVERFAPSVPIYDMRTQEDQIHRAVKQEQLFAYAATGFAALALVLSCLGLYGTLAYSVARRTTEIGIRMALGADRRSVNLMVLRESLVPVVAGIAFGLAAASATADVVQSMLFGLNADDAAAKAIATAALLASALLAAWIPSRRASTVDPMVALRRE